MTHPNDTGRGAPQNAPSGLLQPENALLRVAARHDNLLGREAFEELAAALATYVPIGRLNVVVPEAGEQILYAASVGDGASPVPPFGARFPLPAAQNRRIVMEGAPRICRDTRLGDAVDQLTARSGYLSYVALPIRDLAATTEPAPIVAKLIVCFRDVDRAGDVPLPLLEQVAALFGAGFRRSLARGRERRLAMMLETSRDAMLAWDSGGKITDANVAASHMSGLSRAELIGRPVGELVEELPSAPSAAGPSRSTRTRLERRGAGGARSWLPVSIMLTAVRDDPLVVGHMLVRDISHVVATEQEAAEHLARARRLEQAHRSLLDNAPLVIFRLDPRTGDLDYVSRHAERLLGISPEEAARRPACLRTAHAHPEALERFDRAYERARLGLPARPYEARLVKADGREITASVSLYPLTEAERVLAIEGILVDISAEHAARTQLVQADRLSTLGRLAAGVAHEINNPAAFLMLGLEQLDRSLGTAARAGFGEPERSAAHKLVLQLTESLQRIVNIVRDLRLFAGPLHARLHAPPPVGDVNRAVQSAVTLTRGQLVERARLTVDLGPVPPGLIEQGRLAQVVVNLLVNAAQAIPKNAGREHRIAVTTRAVRDEVQVEILDTGTGIAAADLERIWTPFFTTKEAGIGTGLGLSISRDLIERAGGSIEVTSPALHEPALGAIGTRFIVHLKQAAGAPPSTRPSPPAPSPASAPPITRKRVLVVEDELVLGQALARELEREHDVELVHEGHQALERLATRHFDVVLCDVRMPEMSGEEVYLQACSRGPARRNTFIFMTGIGTAAELTRLYDSYQCPILEKPFSTERLLRAIADIA